MSGLPYSGPRLDRLLKNQKPGKARKLSKKELAAAPPTPEVVQLLRQGRMLQKGRDFAGAAACYTKALSLHPNQPDALNYLGTIGLAAGEIDDAIYLFDRAVRIKPSDMSIQRNLGGALLAKGNAAGAEPFLRRAVQMDPTDPISLTTLANCLVRTGDMETAQQLLEDVLARDPDDFIASAAYGQLNISLGNLEKARKAYRRQMELGRTSPRILSGLASCDKLAPDSPEAMEIERQLQRTDLTAGEHAGLHRAAGEIADRAGRHDEAFQHYLEAERLAPPEFDAEKHRAVYQNLKDIFTPRFFAEREGWGHPSTRPIFIVGMPRSGTTLTEQIISSHPDAAGAGELDEMPRIKKSFKVFDIEGFARRVRGLKRAEVLKLAEGYLKVLDGVSSDALRVTDKMPHNYENLGLIALLFPNARIVHCNRDPRDTCVSCFTTSLVRHSHPYATDLGTLGAYYREYVGLMNHWRAVLPIPIYESKYEELVGSLEENARELIDFIGLPWDPACLAFHESKRAIFTASKTQVRQPLYSSSVARWRRYEKHLGPLIEGLGDLVDA